jgi:hypothetical protein
MSADPKALRACVEAWEPDVCVLGNVRARDVLALLDRLEAVANAAREFVASVDASDETDWDCEVAVDELHLRSERALLALRNALAALDAATKGVT